MAKGIKTGGRNFPKGHKICGGRKPLPADVRAARNMAYSEMCQTVIRIRSMTAVDVAKLDRKKLTLGELAILNAYVKQDYRGIKEYEDRLFGKATEKISLQNESENPLSVQIVFKGLDGKIFKND